MKDCGGIHLIGARVFHIESHGAFLKAERCERSLQGGFARGV